MRQRYWGYRKMRYILMDFGSVDRSSLERLKDRPDVEVYRLDGPDFEDQVDMALLNDLILPLKLTFVGGDLAKRLATAYYGTWIEDTPSVSEDLLAFWGFR
jgi:hypothetical protein